MSQAELAPDFIFRLHSAVINSVHFTRDGSTLISVDADGLVAIWSMQSFRPYAFFKAHDNSVLHAEDWKDKLLTHGRENKIHIFQLPSEPETAGSVPPSLSNLTSMTPLYTLEVNALTYCKFALLNISSEEAWVAVPATLQDELVDIFHLPSCRRVSRSIGAGLLPIGDKTGTVMALQLIRPTDKAVRLVSAYEDGRVAIFETIVSDWSKIKPAESEGWQLVYSQRVHKEPIMSLAISPDLKHAWTVAADHLTVRWTLPQEGQEGEAEALESQAPGRSCIAVRDDNRILAISGWDGKIRIHSTKTFKPLAILEFHRDSVHSVAFGPFLSVNTRRGWMAAAGKDTRISLWSIYPA